MIQTFKKRLYTGFSIARNNYISILMVVLAIGIVAAPVVAQEAINQTDDFEDGNMDGWNGSQLSVVQDSTEGTYSLQQTDGHGAGEEARAKWNSVGPIDLTESFTINGTTYSASGDGNYQTRVGLIDDNGEGAMLVFSARDNAVVLSDDGTQYDASTDPSISGSHMDRWVNWEISSPEGSSELRAKVWEIGDTEPSTPNMTRTFDPVNSPISMQAGGVEDGGRYIQLDSVTIYGTQATDPRLVLDTGNYLEYGENQEYTVYDLQGEQEIRIDVTENATVTTGNTSVITVDQSTNQLQATSDESVNERVYITATYDGRTDIQPVTVASPTIDNLDILPFMWRISAIFLDRGFQMILVGLLLAIAATRVGGVFAGLGIYQMSLTAGWLIGWVPIGLAMVGLFTTLFIGLNIAANIDYSVRR